jgi:hypothetical protein
MTRAICLTSLAILISGTIAGCDWWLQGTPQSQAQNPGKTEAEKAAVDRTIAPFEILEGTPYRFASIEETVKGRSGVFSTSGYEKSSAPIFNFVFLNAETKNSVKLLPKSNFRFTRIERVGRLNAKGNLIKVEALWYEVIRADTNGDQTLDYRDSRTIATSTIAGTEYTELIPQVNRVLNTFQAGPSKITMIYESNKKYFVADLDLGARKVTDTKELPSLE